MLVVVTSFISPHVLPICENLVQEYKWEVHLIELMPMSIERKRLGYESVPKDLVLHRYYEDSISSQMIIDEAEIVIFSGTQYEKIKNRLKNKQITLLYSERIFKKGLIKLLDFRVWKAIYYHLRFYYTKLYLLYIGDMAFGDFKKLCFCPEKMFQFGYFTAKTGILENGNSSVINIVWAGRLVGFKCPLEFLKAIKRIRKELITIKVHLIGDGPGREKIQKYIAKNYLEECVKLYGRMSNQELIKIMGSSQIFVQTSSRGEGWGVVLNEAMSMGCVPVVSDKVGAATSMIKNGVNGFLYKKGNIRELQEKIKLLISDPELRNSMSQNAWKTIECVWNANRAAKRLDEIIRAIQNDDKEDLKKYRKFED